LRKPVKFAMEKFEVKRLVLEAVVEKRLVVVAEVPVAFRKVKFWSVDDPVARIFANVPRPDDESALKYEFPETVIAVDDAYGNWEAVVVVPTKYPAVAEFPRTDAPSTESLAYGEVVPMPTLFEKYDLPNTSKILVSVAVALLPMITTSEVSAG